jgi:DNA-directed RNA polymerase specialized sigma24 family protein
MPVRIEIGRTEFEKLLQWLDIDPETAGREYERIRTRLIRVFNARGCLMAEELADDTIDRVARNADRLLNTYEGEPALYFLAVARNVFLEYSRRPRLEELPAVLVQAEPEEGDESRYECLSKCLEKLPAKQHEMIVGYYDGVKRAKIDRRKQLVALLGTTSEALRVRVLRLRVVLQKCVKSCMETNFDETF